MKLLLTSSPRPAEDTSYSWLLILALLSASQALSPVPYLLAVIVLLKIILSKNEGVPLRYLALAVLLIAVVVSSQSMALHVGTLVRLISASLLLVLVAPLRIDRQQHALAAARRFVLVTLALSAIGFVYALAGGPVLLTILNPDGREALLFGTTLSNSVFPAGAGSLIRPSFIYDEPGAYAFVIDFVLLANYMVNKRLARADGWLILGGILTFSVAHMLVAALIMIAERKTLYLLLIGAMAVLLDLYLTEQSGVSLIVDRFTVADGVFTGDNRSELFANGLQLIADFPLGVAADCNFEVQTCIDRFGSFGESPAFPGAFFGLAGAAAYYVIIALMLLSIVRALDKRHALVVLAVVALIAQRPFLFSLGYNLLIVFLFHTVMREADLHPFWRRSIKRRPVCVQPDFSPGGATPARSTQGSL